MFKTLTAPQILIQITLKRYIFYQCLDCCRQKSSALTKAATCRTKLPSKSRLPVPLDDTELHAQGCSTSMHSHEPSLRHASQGLRVHIYRARLCTKKGAVFLSWTTCPLTLGFASFSSPPSSYFLKGILGVRTPLLA